MTSADAFQDRLAGIMAKTRKKAKTAVTEQIEQLLYIRHPKPEWVVFRELRDGTGGMQKRTFDVFAMNTYPSKRYLRVVYEVKSTRADFMKELNDPRKRESAENLADECYFATPSGLVKPDEVPEGWGLIEMVGAGGLRMKKRARQKKGMSPMPIHFAAAIARRTADDQPDMPAIFWKYAGKEIKYEHLETAADAAVIAKARINVRDAENRVMQADWVKKQQDIMSFLRKRFGYFSDVADLQSLMDVSGSGVILVNRERNQLRNVLPIIEKLTGVHRDTD